MSRILDAQDPVEHTPPKLAFLDIVTGLFRQPDRTFRSVVYHQAKRHTTWLLFAAGTSRMLFNTLFWEYGRLESVPFIWKQALLGGVLRGFIFLPLYAWILSILGVWLDGDASREEMRMIVAWSSITAVPALVVHGLGTALLGQRFYTLWFFGAEHMVDLVHALLTLLLLLFYAFSVRLLLIGIGQAQGFSRIKSTFLAALPTIPVVVWYLILEFGH